MIEKIEISSFDLRYQDCRIKDARVERALLASIAANDILEPLQGVDIADAGPQSRILLNGFKRYRCALRLSIPTVPYRSLGTDEAIGIIDLIRIANAKTLTILEQARLIDELHRTHKISVAEIARLLEKSNGWVSMRLGVIDKMSPDVMEKIFKGEFPAYSYIYSLKPFMRMNKVKKEEIDRFVDLVSGKKLSTRDIDVLARGYFDSWAHGNNDLRLQLEKGDISWVLNRLKEKNRDDSLNGCTGLESQVLRKLDSLRYYMGKMIAVSNDQRLKSPSFCAQALVLVDGILKQIPEFRGCMEDFDDRLRQAQSDLPAS